MYHSHGDHRKLVSKTWSMAQAMASIVCNLKDGGRCHMVAAAVMDIPRPRRRTICGWRFGSGVSLAASITSVKGGALCRRCFPKGVIQEEGYMSPIEDYD